MIKNIVSYLILLSSAFVFNIFYYAWFSWFLFVVIAVIPFVSLILSLPFMIKSAADRFIVYGKEKINIGEDITVCFNTRGKKTLFCPRVKFVLTAKNKFANETKIIKHIFGGNFEVPAFCNCKSLGNHCGKIEIKSKSCRVYDMLGIFFIPCRIKNNYSVLVMPNQQQPLNKAKILTLPVLGYKKKPGSGFSEDYELRQYQNGDSLRSIHWKLSSKSDSLIVKEPCLPVYKKIAIQINLCENPKDNDLILARFCFVCRLIIKKDIIFYAYSNNQNGFFEISKENDIDKFLNSIYSNSEFNRISLERSDMLIYTIDSSGEEVSEC